MPVNNLFQIRRGLSTEWIDVNPVLASGEPGYDISNNVFKIGDGINNWDNLKSVLDVNANPVISGLLSATSGNFSTLLVNNHGIQLETVNIVHSIANNISANGTLPREYIYIFDNLSENYALILPTAIENKAKFTIKNKTNGTIYLQTVLDQTIDGHSDIGLNKKNMSITVISDGSNWNIV
jgi:hypothetical protein